MKLKIPKCGDCIFWIYDQIRLVGNCCHDCPGKSTNSAFPVVSRTSFCSNWSGYKMIMGKFTLINFKEALYDKNSLL